MSDPRKKDIQWRVRDQDGEVTFDGAQLAVLMDLRDELKKLNVLLHCRNFTNLPAQIRGLRRDLAPKKRRKKK